MTNQRIAIINPCPPTVCSAATFAQEAQEFIQKANPGSEVVIISHADTSGGDGTYPIIDLKRKNWWEPVTRQLHKINPVVVHLMHGDRPNEYSSGQESDGDANGVWGLLEEIKQYPIVTEIHPGHGRADWIDTDFAYRLCQKSEVVILKHAYQKWRIDLAQEHHRRKPPSNVVIVPHGSRPDRRWAIHEVPKLRQELGLQSCAMADHVVGVIDRVRHKARWDILLSMWPQIRDEVQKITGQSWALLAAGAKQTPARGAPSQGREAAAPIGLQQEDIAHHYEFMPEGDMYYKVMGICDFIVLPSIDDARSDTLARIIALNKPFIATAPTEGLTAQALESKGGLLFATKQMLREKVIMLAKDEKLRLRLGGNLKLYLDEVVSWELVAKQYLNAYESAQASKRSGKPVSFQVDC